jgi:hypothetical protein
MGTKAQEYRGEAEQAEKPAEETRDLAVSEHYWALAKKWRELAEKAEQHGW